MQTVPQPRIDDVVERVDHAQSRVLGILAQIAELRAELRTARGELELAVTALHDESVPCDKDARSVA